MTDFFNRDPARICRAKGHIWRIPHPHSSYYDTPKNKRTRQCERCGLVVNEAVHSDFQEETT